MRKASTLSICRGFRTARLVRRFSFIALHGFAHWLNANGPVGSQPTRLDPDQLNPLVEAAWDEWERYVPHWALAKLGRSRCRDIYADAVGSRFVRSYQSFDPFFPNGECWEVSLAS